MLVIIEKEVFEEEAVSINSCLDELESAQAGDIALEPSLICLVISFPHGPKTVFM